MPGHDHRRRQSTRFRPAQEKPGDAFAKPRGEWQQHAGRNGALIGRPRGTSQLSGDAGDRLVERVWIAPDVDHVQFMAVHQIRDVCAVGGPGGAGCPAVVREARVPGRAKIVDPQIHLTASIGRKRQLGAVG